MKDAWVPEHPSVTRPFNWRCGQKRVTVPPAQLSLSDNDSNYIYFLELNFHCSNWTEEEELYHPVNRDVGSISNFGGGARHFKATLSFPENKERISLFIAKSWRHVPPVPPVPTSMPAIGCDLISWACGLQKDASERSFGGLKCTA